MSIEHPDRVDAVGVRDGVAVLSIYVFPADSWEPLERQLEALRLKLRTYARTVESARFQARYHAIPARVELVSRPAVPPEVRDLCRRYDVEVREGSPDDAAR